MIQRSEEWFSARLGKVTASIVADIMATTKSGPAASRTNALARVVCERLTGQRQDEYTNGAMQWGIDNEPAARDSYSALTGELIDEVGFVLHPSISDFGCSPDGLVGESGLVEIKCPMTATHIQYLTERKVPGKYQLQMLAQMACTGRGWCDFVSFDPRMPERLQLVVIRFERDNNRISEIDKEVISFLSDVDETIQKLEAIK